VTRGHHMEAQQAKACPVPFRTARYWSLELLSAVLSCRLRL